MIVQFARTRLKLRARRGLARIAITSTTFNVHKSGQRGARMAPNARRGDSNAQCARDFKSASTRSGELAAGIVVGMIIFGLFQLCVGGLAFSILRKVLTHNLHHPRWSFPRFLVYLFMILLTIEY